MKIKKYPQSCLMLETNNKKILIDAGGIKYKETYFEEWKNADVVLITHCHSDHIKIDVMKELNLPNFLMKYEQN